MFTVTGSDERDGVTVLVLSEQMLAMKPVT
jgi:hypothetical protein